MLVSEGYSHSVRGEVFETAQEWPAQAKGLRQLTSERVTD